MVRNHRRSANYTGNKGGECSKAERLAHLLRGAGECPYCGCDLSEARVVSMDHVVAQVFGGQKGPKNIVACCGSCNSSKRHQALADFAAGRGDAEIVRRVRRILRRDFDKYLRLAREELAGQKKTNPGAPTQGAEVTMENQGRPSEAQYPDDGKMLDDALDYLGAISLALEDVAEAVATGAATVEAEDGQCVSVAQALDNLSLGATQRMMQYRAQRALRDGVLDGDTGQVLDNLSEEDA